MTDVGARCPDCAPRRRLPQFEVGPLYLLRGVAAAAVAGAALGVAWWLIAPGDYGFFLGIPVGFGLGYVVGETVSVSTNRKAAPVLQVAAGFGVLVAYVVRSLLWAGDVLPSDDLYGYIVVLIGIVVAAGRLRF